MRKRDDTLRDTLLHHAQALRAQSGTEAINIRALAKMANVSVGTVYNYFAGKDDILLALTEAYWQETMQAMRGAIHGDSFLDQTREIYLFLRERLDTAGDTLMHSLRNVEQTGREAMRTMQGTLQAALVHRMDGDAAIRADIWQATFTKGHYAHFVLMNLVLSLQAKAPDIDFLLEIMRRTLY